MNECKIDGHTEGASFEELMEAMGSDLYWVRFFARPCAVPLPTSKVPAACSTVWHVRSIRGTISHPNSSKSFVKLSNPGKTGIQSLVSAGQSAGNPPMAWEGYLDPSSYIFVSLYSSWLNFRSRSGSPVSPYLSLYPCIARIRRRNMRRAALPPPAHAQAQAHPHAQAHELAHAHELLDPELLLPLLVDTTTGTTCTRRNVFGSEL